MKNLFFGLIVSFLLISGNVSAAADKEDNSIIGLIISFIVITALTILFVRMFVKALRKSIAKSKENLKKSIAKSKENLKVLAQSKEKAGVYDEKNKLPVSNKSIQSSLAGTAILIGIIFIITYIFGVFDSDDIPYTQKTFIANNNTAVDRYADAGNNLQYEQIIEQRNQSLCEELPDGLATDWIGTLHSVSKNLIDSKDSAHIDIRISERKAFLIFTSAAVNVKNYPGSVADSVAAIHLRYNPNTAITKESPLFDQIFSLQKGDKVRFSGQFIKFKKPGECFDENSISNNGKIRWPEYIMRFTSITKVD